MANYQNSWLHGTFKPIATRHPKTRYHMAPSKAQKAQLSLAILKSPIYIGTILKAQGY